MIEAYVILRKITGLMVNCSHQIYSQQQRLAVMYSSSSPDQLLGGSVSFLMINLYVYFCCVVIIDDILTC